MKLCVLVLRGLDAGHIGPYGNRWVDTPSLNALAAQAIVFETHLASHPNADSARLVWRSGRHCFPSLDPIPEVGNFPDLLATLRSANIRTRLLIDTTRNTPGHFLAGWDAVSEVTGLSAFATSGREALAELSRSDSGLVWIEQGSLLPPWDVSEQFVAPYFTSSPDEGSDEDDEPVEPLFEPTAGVIDPEDDLLFEVIQTTYGSAITQLDSALADLLDGLPDDVALLVTSDHGQALGEHGVVGPVRPWLYREVVQVPLILRLPGMSSRRRIAGLTLSVDIAPTIAELFGVRLEQSHGRSLLPMMRENADRREYACLGERVGDEVEWGIWTESWAMRLPISDVDPTPRLYVRPDDRTEVNDLAQHQIEECDALTQTLRGYVAACAAPGPFSPPPLVSVAVASGNQGDSKFELGKDGEGVIRASQ